jgi:hypothetical protein
MVGIEPVIEEEVLQICDPLPGIVAFWDSNN